MDHHESHIYCVWVCGLWFVHVQVQAHEKTLSYIYSMISFHLHVVLFAPNTCRESCNCLERFDDLIYRCTWVCTFAFLQACLEAGAINILAKLTSRPEGNLRLNGIWGLMVRRSSNTPVFQSDFSHTYAISFTLYLMEAWKSEEAI